MVRKRKLSRAELSREHAAALPDREAMSLLSGNLGAMGAVSPDLLGSSSTPDAGAYTGGSESVALEQAQDAPAAASDGTNEPNGTATASSQT